LAFRDSQAGVTLVGALIIGMVVVFAAMLAMKMAPAYIEYGTIKSVLATMAQESDYKDMSPGEVRDTFNKRAQIDNIKAVTAKDLAIEKTKDGPIARVDYEERIPLFANVSVVLEFSASTHPDIAPASE
jgi:hypothetical protein